MIAEICLNGGGGGGSEWPPPGGKLGSQMATALKRQLLDYCNIWNAHMCMMC